MSNPDAIADGNIEGVTIRRINKYMDGRGWLAELFRSDEIEADSMPIMSYISMTLPGIARGPHEHSSQTDLFCFIGPANFRVYLWDNRPSSATYGVKQVIDCGEENPAMLIIPPGVVHAYRNVSDTQGLVFNAPNRLYAGKGRAEKVDEIRHEDAPDSPYRLD